MLLPRGVTGLEGRYDGPPSYTDYRSFRGHCHAAAREAGWTVREVLAPHASVACNYGLAVFEFRQSAIAALVNGVFPFLAFAAPPAEGQIKFEYTDCPVLGAAFTRLGYTVLSAAELARPLLTEMWQELAPHEQKRVKYFRPRRVGDVIFNYWD